MASQMASQQQPPYASPMASVGGVPTPSVDDPICACLILCYVILATIHMTQMQLNLRKGHFFVFSGLMFGLSVARSAALSMRMAWASNQHNASVALAAGILTQAGVIIIFIANLFFTQRVVRATHPEKGWTTPARIIFRLLFGGVFAALIMLIVCVVHSSYTLDPVAQSMDRKVTLTGGAYFLFVAFIPIPAVLLSVFLPRSKPLEKFGRGKFRTQVGLLLFTSAILTVGAGFRLGTNFAAVPRGTERWWLNKACYYCFNYAIEITCSALYAATRFDHRFHIPDGAKQAGDYAAGRKNKDVEMGAEPQGEGEQQREQQEEEEDDGEKVQVITVPDEEDAGTETDRTTIVAGRASEQDGASCGEIRK